MVIKVVSIVKDLAFVSLKRCSVLLETRYDIPVVDQMYASLRGYRYVRGW
jgi:hypothetical protein